MGRSSFPEKSRQVEYAELFRAWLARNLDLAGPGEAGLLQRPYRCVISDIRAGERVQRGRMRGQHDVPQVAPDRLRAKAAAGELRHADGVIQAGRGRPPHYGSGAVRLILRHRNAIPGVPLNLCHRASISAEATAHD